MHSNHCATPTSLRSVYAANCIHISSPFSIMIYVVNFIVYHHDHTTELFIRINNVITARIMRFTSMLIIGIKFTLAKSGICDFTQVVDASLC